MATNFAHLHLEIAHYRNFAKYFPNHENHCEKTVENLLELGVLQISTMFEQSLANVGGYTVVSEDTHDFDTGDDAKMCTVVLKSGGKMYSAQISGITNKIGNLLVQVYERKQEKFYYFVIPNEEFQNVSIIEIPFDLEGNPKIKNRWWKYQVSTFEELAKGLQLPA